jgi:hypothetical protein
MSKVLRSALGGRGTTFPLALILLAAPTARADLRFSQPQVDAGQVFCGTALTHSFAFVNQGPDPVELTDLRASCGCATPHLSQRTYQPGEPGELLLEVHTLSQAPGPHTWRVQVCSRSVDTSCETTLELTAIVVTEVRVEPAAITMFTDSAIGQEVVVTDLRPRPLSIIGVRATSAALTPRLGEPYRDSEGHWARKIHVDLANDCPEGRHEEVLGIYTDDSRYRELQVPVTIVKRSRERVSATPSQVSLTAPPGQPVPSRIVLVRDRDNLPVVVDRVVADDPAVVCHWAAGPDAMATVKIQVDRRQVHAESLHTLVRVTISKPARQTLTIPVTCVLP